MGSGTSGVYVSEVMFNVIVKMLMEKCKVSILASCVGQVGSTVFIHNVIYVTVTVRNPCVIIHV